MLLWNGKLHRVFINADKEVSPTTPDGFTVAGPGRTEGPRRFTAIVLVATIVAAIVLLTNAFDTGTAADVFVRHDLYKGFQGALRI
jgi:hypothetical protein